MKQAKRIKALSDELKRLVTRIIIVGESPWCDMDIVGIYESQIKTIEMALILANREAYSYDLHRRSLKQRWNDLCEISHLPEHQKAVHLLGKLRGVVYHLEKKFAYPGCQKLRPDDAARIVYGLKGNLETHPDLPYCAAYAGLMP